ncbi:hypothetical protein GY45DRAFT_936549 [Cubamyces sp. BRFM 1775]|nr:hypothetical protein GY45DRAFT_936549 [Cubamyces sp. BRFM 1775]
MIIARIGLSEVLDDDKNGSPPSTDLSTLRVQVPGASGQTSIGAWHSMVPIGALLPPASGWENEDADIRMDDALRKTTNAALEEVMDIHLHPLQRPQAMAEV